MSPDDGIASTFTARCPDCRGTAQYVNGRKVEGGCTAPPARVIDGKTVVDIGWRRCRRNPEPLPFEDGVQA